MTDLLLKKNSKDRFTWGNLAQDSADITRKKYIAALRLADVYEISDLLIFVRN